MSWKSTWTERHLRLAGIGVAFRCDNFTHTLRSLHMLPYSASRFQGFQNKLVTAGVPPATWLPANLVITISSWQTISIDTAAYLKHFETTPWFVNVRICKQLAWYCKDTRALTEVRNKLFQCKSSVLVWADVSNSCLNGLWFFCHFGSCHFKCFLKSAKWSRMMFAV